MYHKSHTYLVILNVIENDDSPLFLEELSTHGMVYSDTTTATFKQGVELSYVVSRIRQFVFIQPDMFNKFNDCKVH